MSNTTAQAIGLIGLSCFAFLAAAPAWASYNPPRDISAPSGSITTTGRRGGCVSETASLTAFAPHSHVGQTIADRPTFAWFVPDAQSLPIEFSLYQLQPAGEQLVEPRGEKLIYKTAMQSSLGVMSIALPQTQPALQIGQRYRWQVVLICNPNSPSSAIVTDAELEVVTPPRSLDVSDLVDPDRVAAAGLWYDAITLTLHNASAQSGANQRSLLSNLAQIEAANGQVDRSVQLRQIIELEQLSVIKTSKSRSQTGLGGQAYPLSLLPNTD